MILEVRESKKLTLIDLCFLLCEDIMADVQLEVLDCQVFYKLKPELIRKIR
jgi:hypothetical protein